MGRPEKLLAASLIRFPSFCFRSMSHQKWLLAHDFLFFSSRRFLFYFRRSVLPNLLHSIPVADSVHTMLTRINMRRTLHAYVRK